MTDTVARRKIEVLVDAPLLPRLTALADKAGVTGYTLLPALGGSGAGGRWSEDQVTGAQSKVLFMAVMSADKADKLVDALGPLLESHGLLLIASTVDVVRGGKF
ncbi:hypothetical protein HHL28_14620 [Aerophototrophica crusticola]|uniref:Nitrogen regulatory protein P-II n=1 Tax=Aerophototrophica crusticola TaxID=1709002 RepID=A0A858R9J5_9PROT|nr:hypothetical protein HHL28_14620 [Rhodospirillaceae bacterium B3]